MSTPYAVNFWGSHPDAGHDDCWCGEDFETEVAARDAFTNPTFTIYCPSRDVAYIELVTPNGSEYRKNMGCRPSLQSATDDEWQREIAMEAGMLGGCAAYNDAMGY